MRFNHHQKTAFLLLACFCCLFCGGRSPNVAVAKSTTAKASNAKPTKSSISLKPPVPADPIDRALEGMTTFDFVDTPLKDVVSQISADHSITIKIDLVAIEDAGFDETVPMTGRGNGHPLRSALKLLFMEFDFAAVIKHNTLLITTNEAINNEPEKYMKTELYDITDLQGFSSEDLITSIQDNIDPQSWLDTNGGPGTINDLHSEKKIVLVISHTSNHHHDIVEFLDKLRAIENSN